MFYGGLPFKVHVETPEDRDELYDWLGAIGRRNASMIRDMRLVHRVRFDSYLTTYTAEYMADMKCQSAVRLNELGVPKKAISTSKRSKSFEQILGWQQISEDAVGCLTREEAVRCGHIVEDI